MNRLKQIWYIKNNEESTQLELASDLSRHQRAVNVVRWSPGGEFLASGDDESVIFIWKLKNENEPINILGKWEINVQQSKSLVIVNEMICIISNATIR